MYILRLHRRFARLWLADALSQAGTHISRITLLLYVARTWNSPLALVALIFVETLPGLLAAPFAGAAVDRLSKIRVMVVADLARFGLMTAVLVRPSLAMILWAAALHAVATSFFQAARASAVPALVPAGDLVAANVVDQAASNAVLIAGPAIGAELFLWVGLRGTLLLDCASFLASALLIMTVRMSHSAADVAGAHPIQEILGGWRYVRTHPLALQLCGVFFLGVLCAGVWTPLAPFFVRDHLGAAERMLGWQFVLFGTGAVVGSVMAPRLVRAFGRGPLLLGGFVAEGIAQTAYAALRHSVLSTAMMFVWGAAVSCIAVPFYTILQSVIDARFLGRTFAAVRQAEGLAILCAMGTTALLAGRLDSRTILLAVGVLYCAVATAWWFTDRGRVLRAVE